MNGETPASDRKMLSDVGKMASASAAAQLVTVAGGLALARILGVEFYGLWKTVQLAVTYTAFANFGATYGLSRLSPAVYSGGRTRLYHRMMGASLAVSWLMGGGIARMFLGFAWEAGGGPWATAAAALAILCAIQPFAMHGETALVVEKRFGANARVLLGSTVVRVAFSIGAAWAAGLAGALLVYIVVYGLTAVWMARIVSARLKPVVSMDLWRKVARVGAPIMLLASGEVLLTTADKWIVVAALGAEAMSLYQMAIFPLPFLLLIPVNLRHVVTVDVYDKFGRTGELSECRGVFQTALLGVALGTPWLIGGVYYGMPWLVTRLLPEYQAATPTLLLHTILVFPILAVQAAYPIVVVAKRRKEILLVIVALTLIAAAASLLAIESYGAGIREVLAFQAAAWLLASFWTIARSLYWTGSSVPRAVVRSLLYLSPMAGLAIALPLVSYFVVQWGFIEFTLAHGLVCGVVFTALCLPLFAVLERETKGVSFFLRKLRRFLPASN